MKKQNLDQSTTELTEKIITSELVYRGRFLQVTRDHVELPDQSRSMREYILHPGAALVIPVLDNGNVVMVEQYRHALRRTFLEFPAGKKDRNESFLESAHRELKEETGFESNDLHFLTTIHPTIGYANEEIQIFLARNLVQTGRKLDAGEFLNLKELSLQELSQKVQSGDVTDVKTQIGYFWLDRIVSSQWEIPKLPE